MIDRINKLWESREKLIRETKDLNNKINKSASLDTEIK
jgi:hypothetical protein